MRKMAALLGLVLAFVPPAARAAGPVDMLLVLAADVSRSVTEPKFRLQREGTAAALAHPDVLRAIVSGPNRRIAVCLVEWATVGMQAVVVDWTVIDGAPAAHGFGDKLIEAPRSFAGSTAISGAIDFSVGQLERAPFTSERRVIDISGDGNNNSGRSVIDARDEALAKGVTINAPQRIVPAGAHQSRGRTREIFPEQCHRRARVVHRRRRKPRGVRPGAHQEADPGDREPRYPSAPAFLSASISASP